jgi:WD40 repeat protein
MRPALFLLLLPTPALAAEPEPLVRLGSDRFRQTGPVRAIAYSPDGKLLATADGDNVHIWDSTDGRRLSRRVPDRAIEAVWVANDRTILAVGRDGRQTRFLRLDSSTGAVLADAPTLDAPAIGSFSPDGRWLAVSDENGRRLQVIDTTTGKPVWVDVPKKGRITAVAFRGDGNVLALAEYSVSIRLVELPAGKLLHEYRAGVGGLTDLAFAPDGQSLIGNNGSAIVVRIDAETGRMWWTSKPHRVERVFFPPGGASVINFGEAGYPGPEMWHWLDAATGRSLARHMDTGRGSAIAVRPDGKVLAVGGSDGLITQWDLEARTRLVDNSADPPGPATDLHFSANGSKLTGTAGDVYEWDVAAGQQTRLTNLFVGPSEQAAFSPDRKWVLRSLLPGPLRIEGFSVTEIATGKQHLYRKVRPYAQARALGSGRIVIGDRADLRVFDAASGKLVFRTAAGPGRQTVAAGGTTVVRLAPSPDHLHVTRWELPAAEPAGEWDGRPADPSVLDRSFEFRPRLSADGGVLATSFIHAVSAGKGRADPQEIRTVLFDANVGRYLGGWVNPSPWPELAFSADRRAAACFGPSQPGVVVREVATGRPRAECAGRLTRAACFSPDGRVLAISTSPGPVALWDLIGQPAGRWADVRPAERWDALAAEDAGRAFEAIRQMRQHPTEAVTLLKERMARATPTADWMAARIKMLDAPQFRDREKATGELAEAGELVAPQLRAALKAASPEARERLNGLLAKVDTMTPERLRAIRACEVLEGIGSAEARDLLATWAKGPPGATLTREATESLERLKGR